MSEISLAMKSLAFRPLGYAPTQNSTCQAAACGASALQPSALQPCRRPCSGSGKSGQWIQSTCSTAELVLYGRLSRWTDRLSLSTGLHLESALCRTLCRTLAVRSCAR
eukprot:scaffold11994_cov85-Phaeocystis_antarctica.AAC.2